MLSLLSLFLLWGYTAHSQLLDSENKLSITLSDGTQVILYGQAISLSDRKSKNYYYLPTEPRLSVKPDGTPQFLFLKYTTEEREEQGGLNGGLLHMLMEWGLTPAQQSELETILKNGQQGVPKKSVLKGAADVMPDGDQSLRIISATLSDDTLAPSVVQSLCAPVIPGAKMAVAARLDANGAQLLASTFEDARSITDLSVELGFTYTVRSPAAKGRATVYWNKIYEQYKKDSAVYKEKRKKESRGGLFGFVGDALFGKKTKVQSRSYDEVRSVVETMVEREYIKVDFDENLADERVTKIREAFFDYFLDKMASSADSDILNPPSNKEQEAMPNIKYGKKYSFKREFFQSMSQKKVQVFRLDTRLAVVKPFSVTGNLAGWYDGVKNNKRCVASVYLNDPFFQHRDINVLIGIEAEDMFGKEISDVEVMVKKKRNKGNDFYDSRLIDREYLKNNGIKATITYARGEDKNPEVYEYKTKWNLKGGETYPKDPKWTKGDWGGITLEPPIKARAMEFECDLDELAAVGIVRATLQMRYYKYGEEVETNIPITVSRGEPLVSETIYVDRDSNGYAYRLVLTHKEKGKMALDWSSKINDDYVYAIIPTELTEEDPDYLEKIITYGEAIVSATTDGKVPEEAKILDKFKDVMNIVKSD